MKPPVDFGLRLFFNWRDWVMRWGLEVCCHAYQYADFPLSRYPPVFGSHFLVYWSRQLAIFFIIDPVLRIRIRDPVVWPWISDPGWRKYPDRWSGMIILDHFSESLWTVFRAKSTTILWCGSGIRNLFDPGSGREIFGSLIRDKHYGSVTLHWPILRCLVWVRHQQQANHLSFVICLNVIGNGCKNRPSCRRAVSIYRWEFQFFTENRRSLGEFKPAVPLI
jgi:hypothetical protein